MKAITCYRYGSPDVLNYEDIEKPVPADDEVLIKVCAASVNPVDYHSMTGLPYLIRPMTGLRSPKHPGVGRDLAGRVEEVGRNVTGFKPGTRCSAPAREPSPSMPALPSRP